MSDRRILLLGIACLLALAGPAPADPDEEIQEAFAWFDGLGYTHQASRPFVKVATGNWYRVDGEDPVVVEEPGLLLADEGPVFRVLMLDLREPVFTKSAPDVAVHERIGWRPADLDAEAAPYLAEDSAHGRLTAFVLAWICRAQGRPDLASALAAKAIESRRGGPDLPETLRGRLAEDLSTTWMWAGIRLFGDPGTSRRAILAHLRRLVTALPDTFHHARAKEGVKLLERMVMEDEQRPAGHRPPLEEMAVEERVAELIFQLRDQNGQQWSQPGSCDVFADPRGLESPADRLVRIGYEAVPQLIEALSDERFTRSVGFWRDFTFSHYVLRVGDCAAAVLSRIAGRTFYLRTSTSGAMWKDGEARSVQDAARAWWAEFQEKGEVAILIEGIERGDWDGIRQAVKLVANHHEIALAPISRGIRYAESDVVRSELVRVAASIPGEGPVPLLLEEMIEAPGLQTRVAAAHCLVKREHPAAIPALLDEWRRTTTAAYGLDEMLDLLARHGGAEAVAALGERWFERSAGIRYKVLEALADTKVPLSVAAEDLFVRALDDAEPRLGLTAGRDGKSFSDPRICDFAAHVLGVRAPERYEFDIEATRTERDRARADLKSAWRRARGLPEEQGPESPQVEPLPPERSLEIREASIGARSLPVEGELGRRYAELGGRPLSAEGIAGFLRAWLAAPSAQGLRLSAHRPAGLGGVYLELTVLPDHPERNWDSGSVSTHLRVRLGRQVLLGSSGGGSWSYYESRGGLDDFEQALARLVESAPEESFEITAELRGRR